jgi:hypothetical protein
MDVTKMAEAVFAHVRGYVAQAIAPIAERLESLAERLKAIEERPPPEPGKDADPKLIVQTVDEAVDKRLPAKLEEGFATLAKRLDAAVKAIPAPRDGEDGTSVTVEDIYPVLMLEIGKWAVDFERRAQDILLRAVSAMPKVEGKDGRDALQLEDFDIALDGRDLTISLRREDVEIAKTVRLNTVLDAGFWKQGKDYQEGDGVTFGGSYWIAQKNTDAKPELGREDWRLAVKKGRDAKPDVVKVEPAHRVLQVGRGGES